MNKIILLRGCPGSGKTTFLMDNSLIGYALSNDNLRLCLGNPIVNIAGEIGISQNYEKKLNELFFNLLTSRMERGETIIIDACIQGKTKLSKIKNLSEQYRYRVYSYNLGVDLDTALTRNSGRKGTIEYVPEDIVKKIHNAIEEENLPSYITKLNNTEELNAVLDFECYDMGDNEYKYVKVIGDVHGCISPLLKATEEFKIGASEDSLPQIIFSGDYVDRGANNQKVVEHLIWLKKNFPKHIRFIKGNHEVHLELYANTSDRNYDGVGFKSKVFKDNTIPDLEQGKSSEEVRELKKDIRRHITGTMSLYSMFSFGGEKYLVTHAGLPKVFDKNNALYYSGKDLYKGIGGYDINLGEIYLTNMVDSEYMPIQVHGHRYTPSSDKCICLENSIEYGGDLKTYEIYSDSSLNRIVYYKNDDECVLGVKSNTGEVVSLTKNVEVNKMIISDGVNIKNYDDIISLNFNRDTFKGKKWDSQTIKARGLFVDKTSGEVVIRSYNKFFNENEVEETKMDNIFRNVTYPVYAYEKYNGFLGLLSVRNGDFIFASKTSITSDHSKIFKDIFEDKVGDNDKYLLKSILGKGYSCVFEVCDSVRDPHIYSYSDKRIVLLDFFKNDLNFNNGVHVDFTLSTGLINELKSNTSTIEFKVCHNTCYNADELKTTISRAKSLSGIEGLVFTDSNGFMFKVKGNEYLEFKSRFNSLGISRTKPSAVLLLENKVDEFFGYNDFSITFSRHNPSLLKYGDRYSFSFTLFSGNVIVVVEKDGDGTYSVNITIGISKNVHNKLKNYEAVRDKILETLGIKAIDKINLNGLANDEKMSINIAGDMKIEDLLKIGNGLD